MEKVKIMAICFIVSIIELCCQQGKGSKKIGKGEARVAKNGEDERERKASWVDTSCRDVRQRGGSSATNPVSILM